MGAPGPLWPALLPPALQGDDARCAVAASGVRVRFVDGTQRLCATSGLWNANLGYGNPAVTAAASAALHDASYLGVFRAENHHARAAAAALVEAASPQHYARVLFSTSGGAANDLAMKLARHHQALRGQTGRRLVVGLRDSYHGLTYGSFALTGQALDQPLYAVDHRNVRHVPANAVDHLTALVDREGPRIAAVVEPVLGTGTVALDDGYVDALLRLRDQHGFLVVADEVATGFGRTGTMFATQRWPRPPDVLVLSKALTNGTSAAAAVLVSHTVAERFTRTGAVLSHGETQAGTPVSCAAVLATLAEFDRLDAVARGRDVAAALTHALDRLRDRLPVATELAGPGLFRTLRLVGDDGAPLDPVRVPDLVAAVRHAGALVHPGLHGIQLVPALVYTDDHVAELVDCLDRGIRRFLGASRRAA